MTKPAKKTTAVPVAERESMIRVAAYYLYERQGRQPGRELEDWVAAEAQIDAMLSPAGPAAASVEVGTAAAPREVAATAKVAKKAGPAKAAEAARTTSKPAPKKTGRASGRAAAAQPREAVPTAKPAAKGTRATKA
jgi:hypothetical protein